MNCGSCDETLQCVLCGAYQQAPEKSVAEVFIVLVPAGFIVTDSVWTCPRRAEKRVKEIEANGEWPDTQPFVIKRPLGGDQQ